MFLAFFLMGKVVQANINSFTKGGQAQTTPGRERMVAQKPQTGKNSKRPLMGGGNTIRKMHLVNWRTVCLSKEKGGLGIRTFALFYFI